MDEFSVYGDYFEEDLDNLEKVLIRCLGNKSCIKP
jgi:hypothetical protein